MQTPTKSAISTRTLAEILDRGEKGRPTAATACLCVPPSKAGSGSSSFPSIVETVLRSVCVPASEAVAEIGGALPALVEGALRSDTLPREREGVI